jgi:hypothetical protein
MQNESKELDARIAEIMQLESSYEYAKLEPLKIIELVSDMDKKIKSLISGVKKAMEVLEDTALDTIWMDTFNETMWEHLACIIDFEVDKQQELPLEDTTAKQLTQTQQKLDVAVEALEFYANNYRTLRGFDGKRTYEYIEPNEHVQNDEGRIAKAALNTIRGKD